MIPSFQQCRGDVGKEFWIVSGADDVEHHAQRINIRLLGARTFRRGRHITGCSHKCVDLFERANVSN